jgi:hypothetical protein
VQGPSKPSASSGSAGAAGAAPQTYRELHEQRGLIPRALEDCFALVAAANAKIASTPAFLRDKNAVTNVQLVLSAFEVYNSKVQDLLSEFRALASDAVIDLESLCNGQAFPAVAALCSSARARSS